MYFYQLIVSYDGTNFCGSAYQNKEIRTVEGEIKKVFNKLLNTTDFDLTFAGRTDKGVHAINQVLSLSTKNKLIGNKSKQLYVLNRMLKPDIYIKDIILKKEFFNARFDAKTRSYIYQIELKPFNLFHRNYYLQYSKDFNLNKAKQACKLFLGTHNFWSYSTSEKNNNVRTINYFCVNKVNNVITFKVIANGFLKSQVRMMIAKILQYASNEVDLNNLKNLLDNPKKGSCMKKIEPNGLYFLNAKYK